jgi:outer membrane protein assembly factor BamB
VLDEDTAYVADAGAGVVRAYDRADGEQRWSTTVEFQRPRMALRGGRLYVPGTQLVALDANSGDRLWAAGDGPYYAVMVTSGFAYVAGSRGVEAINVDNQDLLWHNDEVSVVDSAHVFGEDRLFAVGTDHAGIRALAPGGGNTRWRRLLGTPLTGEPVVADGLLLVPVEDSLTALNAVSGEIEWTYDVPVRGSVVAADGTAYGNGADGETFAVDLASGEAEWHRSTVTSHNGPVLAGGLLYVATDDGYVLAFDAATGSERWRRRVAPGLDTGLAVAGGDLVVAGESRLYTLTAGVSNATPTAGGTPTETRTETATGTATASSAETSGGGDDEDDDGASDSGGDGLLVILAAAVILLLGGAGGVALVGLDAVKEALGLDDDGGPGR